MITGIDYIFNTEKKSYFFFYDFENKIRLIWSDFYKEHDLEDEIISVFYSKNKIMFDVMDDNGYSLNKNGEGSFLIMFNYLDSKKNRITLVLPKEINDSSFCEKVYNLVRESI